MQNLKKQEKGDKTPEVEGNIKRLREQISAKESEIEKQQATLSNLQASAQTTANAWARTLTTFKANTYRMARIAMVVGTRIVNALNHGAADVTGEAWQRNEPIVANEMQKMGEVAVATGNEINAAMGGSAEVAVKELQKVEATAVTTGSEISTAVGGAAEVVSNELHQTGQAGVIAGRQISGAMEQSARKSISVFTGLKAAVQSIGKAGFAIGGAVTAMGFAAQTVSYSLSSMGIISEYESEKLYKVTQLITLIGAIGGIVAPVLGAMFSSLGAIAAVVGTVVTGIVGIGGAIFTFLVSPVGLAVAGITAGIFAINYLIKSIFGVDLLQNLISSMLDGIAVAFNAIKEQLPGIATGIWTAISPMAEKIKPIFDFLWKGIQEVFLAPFAPILEKFQPVLDLVVDAFDKAVNQISGAWEYFMDNFGGRLMHIVDPALDVAKRLINALNHNPTEKIPQAWELATEKITGNIESLPVSAQVAGNDINSALSKIDSVDVNKNSILKTGLEGLKSSGIINDRQSSAIDYALVKSGVMNKEDIQELNQAVSELKDPTLLLQETAKKLSVSATQLRIAVMGLTLIQKPADIIKAYKAAFEGKAKEEIKEQITAPIALHGLHNSRKLKPHKPKFTAKQLLNKEFQNLKKQVTPFIEKITETLFPLILANPFTPYIAGITAVISLFEILTPKVNILGMIAGALSSPFAFILGVINGFIKKLGIVKDSADAIKSPFVAIYDYAKDTFNTFAEIFNKFFSAGETIGENLATPFLYAKEKIQSAWQGFVEWFEQMPLVKMAGDVAQGLINALNHNPTEKIPQAWEGATEKMKSYLDNFLKYALTVAGAMTAAFTAKKIFGMMQGSTNLGVVGAASNAGKLSGKIKSFSMYANLTNDIAELSGNELPDFVKPIIMATTAMSVMVDMGESVLPKLAGAFGKVSGMVGGLSTAIGAMSPLLSVTLVGAIALFATAWFNNLFGIQDKTKAALEWIGQAFQDAITTIQGAWQGFIDNFGGKLASIVQPALDVAQALINALNHNPTERIPQAWELATEKITGNIESLPVSAQVAGEDINSALSKIDSVNLSDKALQGIVAQKLEGMIQRSLASGKTNQESLQPVAEAGYKAPKMFSDFIQWLDQVITEKVGSGTGNPSIAGKVVSTSIQAYKNYQEEKESFKHLEDYGQTEPVAQISRLAVGISEIFEKLLPVLVAGVNPIMATGEASLVTAAIVKAAQNKVISTAVIKGSTKLFEQQVGVPIGIAAPEFILNADKSGFDKQNNIVNADKSGFEEKNNIVPLPKRSNFIDPTTPLPGESQFIGPVMPREESFMEKITSWFNGLFGGDETTLADNVLLGSVPTPGQSDFIGPMMPPPLPGESQFISPVMPREESFIEKITSWFNGLFGGNKANNAVVSAPLPDQPPVLLDFTKQIDTAIKLAKYDGNKAAVSQLSKLLDLNYQEKLQELLSSSGKKLDDPELQGQIQELFNSSRGQLTANQYAEVITKPEAESPGGRYLKLGQELKNSVDNPSTIKDITDQMGRDFNGFVADVKNGSSDAANNLALEFEDRWDYLQRNGFTNFGEIFEPGMDEMRSGLGQLGESFQVFGNDALRSLKTLDFKSLDKAMSDFGTNAWSQLKQIGDGFGSASLSAIAFGMFSLLSLSPVNLAMIAAGAIVLAITTNFLGLRDILFGVVKIVTGLMQIIIALGQAVAGVINGIQLIAKGVLSLDKNLLMTGVDKIITSVKTALEKIGNSGKLILSGIGDAARGLFYMIQNMASILANTILLPFRGLRIAVLGIKNTFSLLGTGISLAITQPQIAWQGFLNILERIRVKAMQVVEALATTPVSKTLRAFKSNANAKKVGKQIDLDQQLTNEAPIVTPGNQPIGIKGRIRNAVGGAVNQVKGFVGLGKNNKDLAPENNLSTLGQAIPKPGESGFIGPIAQVANSTVSKKPPSGASFGSSNLKASGNKTVAGSGKFGSSIDAANQVFTPVLSNNISQLGFAASMISPAIAQPLMMVGALAQSFEILKDMGSDFVGVLFKMFPALEVFIGKAVLAATSNTFLNKTFTWLSATATAAWTSITAAAASLWGFVTSAWASSGANTFLSSTYAIVSTTAIVAGMGISAAAASLWGFIASAWASIGANTFLSGTLLSISATATAAWISITTTTAYIWGFIASAFAAGGVGGALSASFMVLSSMATIAWGSITAAATSLWGFVASAFTSNTISALLAGGFAMVSTTATAAYTAIMSKVGMLGVYIIAAWKSSGASASLSSMFGWVSVSAMTAWGSITATASSLWGFFTSAFAAGGINGVLSSTYAIVSASAMTAWGSITATAASLWGFVTSALVSGGANTFLSSTYAIVSTSAIVAGMGISAAATSLWGFVTSAFAAGGVVGVLSATFGVLSTAATAAWIAITGPMLPFIVGWAAIIGVLAAVYIAFKTNFLGIGDLFSGFFGTLFEGFGQIFGGVFDAIKQGFSDIVGTFAFVGKAIMQPFQPLFDLFSDNTGGGMFKAFGIMFAQVVLLPFRALAFILTGIIKIITILIQGIAIVGGLISGVILSPFYLISFVVRGIVSLVSGIGSALSGSFNAIVDFIRNVPVLGNILTLLFPKENYQPQKYATGGLITGSGTSTNDSIPIMASRNEYMVNAAATRQHYGLLEAINNGEDLPGMTAMPVAAPRIIQPPSASEYASVSRGAIAMPPMEFNFNFGDIIVQGSDGGASAANEFLESLEPQLEQKVREIMQKMLEFMK
jgi:phage-related protein